MQLPSIIEIESVQSTNATLGEMLINSSLENWSTVFTYDQTAGRGQAGNTWETQKGQNIICSILLCPGDIKAHEQFIISKAVAVGIIDFLNLHSIEAKIKWPNDIYVEDKKICGILIENKLMGFNIETSIIGIGLNVNQTSFSNSIPNPTSLQILTNKQYDPLQETEKLRECIYNRIEDLKQSGFEIVSNHYHEHLYRLNEKHTFKSNGNLIEGYIRSVENTGLLHFENLTSKSNETYAFKEIEYCI